MAASEEEDLPSGDEEVLSDVHIGRGVGCTSMVSVFVIASVSGVWNVQYAFLRMLFWAKEGVLKLLVRFPRVSCIHLMVRMPTEVRHLKARNSGSHRGILQGRQDPVKDTDLTDGGSQAMAQSREADPEVVGVDEEGDLVLPRKRVRLEQEAGVEYMRQQRDGDDSTCTSERVTEKGFPSDKERIDSILLHHHLQTRLREVGLQVWRGALLLSDFILHKCYTSTDFQNLTALELGAGTDRGANVLDNCIRNVVRNSNMLRKGQSTVRVRELDWQKPWPPPVPNGNTEGEMRPYIWNHDDVVDVGNVSLLLAADVVYSEELTSAFFEVVTKLMPPRSNKVLYVALEKRYNFSLSDLDVVANGYEHFRSFFSSKYQSRRDKGCDMRGERVDIGQIKQYIQEYERGDNLELWEIRRC